MTHTRLLKATILILHLLQITVSIQENEHISAVIKEMQMRTKIALRYSVKERGIFKINETE